MNSLHYLRGSAFFCTLFALGTLVSSAQDHTHLVSRVEIEVREDYRHIVVNGIPDHEPGKFPNRGNPNTIREQSYSFRVAVNPLVARNITPMHGFLFSVALNGVPFDPGTAEFWNRNPQSGWNYEALSGKINLGLDDHHAHVQPNGAYHYHGLPTGMIKKLGGDDKMLLAGYAADGFPLYTQFCYSDPRNTKSPIKKMRSSYRLKQGARPSGDSSPGGHYDGAFVQDFEFVEKVGDLDECNGHFGVTLESPDGIYHYHLTEEFPFVPRHFRGTPDPSFRKQGSTGLPRGGNRRPPHLNGAPP